jgi:hypothetical protein
MNSNKLVEKKSFLTAINLNNFYYIKQYNEGGGCADKQAVANEGMNAIKDMTTNGNIKIKIV